MSRGLGLGARCHQLVSSGKIEEAGDWVQSRLCDSSNMTKTANSSSKRGRARARYCSSNKPNMEPKAISESPPSPSHPVNQTVRIPLQSAGRLLLSLDAKASPYLVTLSLLALPCIYPQQTPESILQLVRPPITGLIITPESKTASMTPTAQWSPVPTTPSALIKT